MREFTEDRAFLRAVVSMPAETFKSSGADVKCSLLFLQKFTEEEQQKFDETYATAKAAVEVPWASYTEPELAQAGLTEAEARKRYGADVTVLGAEFSGNDRARAELKGKGLVKVIVVKGRPVGASIAGPQAGELIGLWALAISARLKMSAIAGMVAPYPTLGEVSKRAAGAYFSPKLFESPALKRLVRIVQRWVP